MKIPRELHVRDGKSGAALGIRVTPRCSHNQIVDIMDDGTVKICLTAPPVEGKANAVLIKFLSEVLEVPNSRIEIVAGQTGRNKLVTIIGVDAAYVQQKILERVLHS